MSEDKRIVKTKNNLKAALKLMLETGSFDKITVKDLCRLSQTSRITFYTHFGDKYELADEVFHDMTAEISDRCKAKQRETSAHSDPVLAYCNLLECILDMYEKNEKIFAHITLSENQYLYFSFSKYVLSGVESFIVKCQTQQKMQYSPKRAAAFLCYGLWGFINASLEEGCPFASIKTDSKRILSGVLNSDAM